MNIQSGFKEFSSITILSILSIISLIPTTLFSADTKSFIPDAPIINFRLPMFNNEGYQNWNVQGDQGIYINEEQVDIIGMKLNILSGDKQNLCEATIESPEANIFLHDNKAKSQNSIKVIGNNYLLSGQNWSWDGNIKKIIINQNVKVVFNQILNNLFTYEKNNSSS